MFGNKNSEFTRKQIAPATCSEYAAQNHTHPSIFCDVPGSIFFRINDRDSRAVNTPLNGLNLQGE